MGDTQGLGGTFHFRTTRAGATPVTRNVAVLVFPDVELLDFAGPFEVFSVASRWAEPPAFSVVTVAETLGP